MRIDGQQLAAFAAVIELGSFDAAAARLHVTPSAISQRIKALEQRVGQVLVVREKPCSATAAGVPLLRLAAQTALLEAETLAERYARRGPVGSCGAAGGPSWHPARIPTASASRSQSATRREEVRAAG